MRNHFFNILQNGVKIPIIQRDYAQGRIDPKTTKIREGFLDALFKQLVESASNPEAEGLELDFIYGFNRGEDEHSSFIPLDGQQRLTTLWLLYWFVAAKEEIPTEETESLRKFLYETRHSTTLFFEQLLKFIPSFSYPKLSLEIKDQGWYFDTWSNDPGIRAMLVTLDDIAQKYEELELGAIWQSIATENCPFFFHQLDMGEVGLTDDLYIKMNSRGKPLTEFEYFKARFANMLGDEGQKLRFENSVDQEWVEAIWSKVIESWMVSNADDVALKVDACFLNLFNFLTSVIAYEQGVEYKDTVSSTDSLQTIYSDQENQNRVFDTFDVISRLIREQPDFWESTFRYSKEGSGSTVRLFVSHRETDLLNRCLLHGRLSMPEQLLLHGCICHLREGVDDFPQRVRVVRNLVVNSDNELRESILGRSFQEIESYMRTGDLSVLNQFKTDQIVEERDKAAFRTQYPEVRSVMETLEDSDLLRGSISILPFDSQFVDRARVFLEIFEEDEAISNFKERANMLLTFGDYSQETRGLYNLLAKSRATFRRYFTTPGYNKEEFRTQTKPVLLQCLDYFIENPGRTYEERIQESMEQYETHPKDWRYYFIRYPSAFRDECEQGFYSWEHHSEYLICKRRKRQLNGFHWDPFLVALKRIECEGEFSLGDYGDILKRVVGNQVMHISSVENGFSIKLLSINEGEADSGQDDTNINLTLLEVEQNEDGYDLEDRIEKFRQEMCQNLTSE